MNEVTQKHQLAEKAGSPTLLATLQLWVTTGTGKTQLLNLPPGKFKILKY